ncbi:hypothetical protein COT75_00770 [Candidatus Beckwithbacteria bacterium CG10_big_fil_rev_8_21_14_0_10_34_10]|uniref:Uncharacterized protein n=1 Tax=Candidatus Beckwithbacteria bacterium CG10_big_fil_rev_8_21_14_0_10_34_10 TaxID=1974495 RepID=A0A2H0WAK7_9BACT|nr:MAG: hypothetical protein COT75_00770 [Candidatus Beckwithbacteria bacterium CG10_big_fil_rev_8_21_14_0_10_34_10]
MLFPKGEFTIGQKEKHKVSFSTDFWWGRFNVFVDGSPTSINGKSMISGPFTLEVGDKEKHTLTFQLIFSAIFAAFRDKEVQVLVDGKLFKTF